jgi:peptidyl-dipeptidase Dcp
MKKPKQIKIMKKVLLMMTFSALVAGCAGDSMPVAVLPEIDTSNPLLAEWDTPYATPPFDKIKITDYEPAFETAIAVSRAEIDAIVNNPAKPTFKNTIVAMERQGALLDRIAGIFYNLREADTSDEMDAIALRIQPKMTELSNDIALNPQLFERVKAVYEGSRRGLSDVDIKLLEDTYKSFSRSGAALSDEDKETYRKYTAELSEATLLFGQNSLSATNDFAINITSASKVAELPDFVKESLAADAKARGEKGWTVTLKAPSYVPFMTYSSQRDIKEQLYRAYNTRALGGKFDNSEIIRNITSLRLKIANLLGYETYADYVLEERMAETAPAVNSFLAELRDATVEYAKKDYSVINEYAASKGHKGDVMPWDWAYYTEKYKSEKYSLDDEQVKPYLKLDNVINGVFMLAEKLYGLKFVPNKDIAVYHPDVTAYEVYDAADGKNELLSILYLDFFPRESKRSGAWMTEFRGTKVIDGVETRPLVSLVMNFTKPTETTPSLLTFDEFTTFLHEFGHALHGMLAKGEYESMNGTNVYRDFVELPSQILENWAVEKEYLDMWAVHYKTGEPIPAELVKKIVDAKNYLAAYGNVRQLSFGISDMAWHTLKQPYAGEVEPFEKEAMSSVQVTPWVDGTAMSPSFTHIFSGGYAAGYYGYKWAEVLAADAFSLFKEKGIFDAATAKSFRHLLEQGGQRHAMDIYVEFRGHKPETKALVESMGLK